MSIGPEVVAICRANFNSWPVHTWTDNPWLIYHPWCMFVSVDDTMKIVLTLHVASTCASIVNKYSWRFANQIRKNHNSLVSTWIVKIFILHRFCLNLKVFIVLSGTEYGLNWSWWNVWFSRSFRPSVKDECLAFQYRIRKVWDIGVSKLGGGKD